MYKNRTPAEDAHFFSSPCSSLVDVLQGTFVVRLHAVHDVGALVDFCKDEVALMRHRSRLSSCACTLLFVDCHALAGFQLFWCALALGD